MPSGPQRLRDKFLIKREDGSFDDGIAVCEQIIRDAGGTVQQGWITEPPQYAQEDLPEELADAIQYLVEEWDYACATATDPAGDEVRILLPSGGALCCSLDGQEVKIRDDQGHEILHWESTEWEEDPDGVMGAIFGAATSPLAKLLEGRVLEGKFWNYRSPGEQSE